MGKRDSHGNFKPIKSRMTLAQQAKRNDKMFRRADKAVGGRLRDALLPYKKSNSN